MPHPVRPKAKTTTSPKRAAHRPTETIDKDAVVLTQYQICLTQAHDGIVLTLYGDDSAGNAREIATVVMHPNGAEEIANQLLHAQLRAQES